MINDYKVLTCDSCGLDRVVKQTEAGRARLESAREGWKIFTYGNLTVKTKAGNIHTVSRLWDSCPDCQLPDPEAVQVKVQDEEDRGVRRKARAWQV
jgi:hypothetical protein